MKKYTVTYEHKTHTKYSFWVYAKEIIEAKGIVHAQKLATDHLRELKKRNKNPMRISKILERNTDD